MRSQWPHINNAIRLAHHHFIVLYHNYATSMANSPEFLAKMKAINPDQIVVLERGVTPLVDAVRARYGLKTTVVSRRPLA